MLYGKIKDGAIVPSNQKEFSEFLQLNEGKGIIIKKDSGVRTDRQNAALHLLFSQWAEKLNESGYTVQLVLKEKIDLEWDGEKVKELLWRPAQIAVVGKRSTTKLDKVQEIDLVFDHLNRHMGEKFGIHVPFPKEENPTRGIAYPLMDTQNAGGGHF